MNLIINFFKNYFFLFLYFGLFFINSIQLIDRSAQFWFSISLVNIFLFIYLYLNKYLNKRLINSLFRDRIVISYLLFLLACSLSFINTFNVSESLIVLFRYFTTFSSIVLLSIYLLDLSYKFFALILAFFFLLELSFTFNGYLSIISQTVYSFEFANYLAGIGANKNISAALYCMQLPFLFFLAIYFKNYVYKLIFSILLVFSFYNIFILGSRTALIIILAQSVTFLLLLLFSNKKLKSISSSFVESFSTWFLPLFISLLIYSSSLSTSNNSSLVSRVSSIQFDNVSVSERLKFYNYTIDYIVSNPITPLGIGNWKISSVDWDSSLLNGYTVPYHAHNDFLELAAEITFFGALLYFLVFFFTAFQLIKSLNDSKTLMDFYFYLALLLSGTAFFIDSLFNFPNSRPLQVMILIFSISFTIVSKLKARNHE